MSNRISKLHSTMLHSSVWRENDQTRLVWVTLLMLKDRHGVVEASIGGLADAAKVSVPDAQRALQSFLAPDPDSKSKNDEGRRIREIDGGWLVINHEKYAAAKDEEEAIIRRAILTRERQRKCREKKGAGKSSPVTDVTLRHAPSREKRDTKPLVTENPAQPTLFPAEPPAPAETPESKAERAREKRYPTTGPAKRIAALFRRRLTTAWDPEEVKTFKAIGPIDLADLDVIEAYYARERAKGDGDNGGKHRRDLKTFLNNFTTELDRARVAMPARSTAPDVDPAGWREFLAGIQRPHEAYRYAPGFLKTQFGKNAPRET